ncbi:hypothetical protein DSECCO2_279150 [anaerobic digester metagenome]
MSVFWISLNPLLRIVKLQINLQAERLLNHYSIYTYLKNMSDLEDVITRNYNTIFKS